MNLIFRYALTGAVFGCFAVGAPQAQAFDFFGLFGDSLPEPSPEALPYEFKVEAGEGDDGEAAAEAARGGTALDKLKADAPRDGEGLVRRAQSDIDRIYDSLWAAGYYNARLELYVAGVRVHSGGGPEASAARAAEALRARARVPIVAKIAPGRAFKLRRLTVAGPDGRPLDDIPAAALKLKTGDPARAGDLRAAQARVVDYYRGQSRPLTKAAEISVVVNHDDAIVDAAIRVAPGVVAPIGDIEVAGSPGVPGEVVRSFIYPEPTESYSPEKMAAIRKSVLKVQAIGSVRVIEADHLDAQGRLPIRVETAERPKNLIGAAARYSTLDGPNFKTYWEDRNLFGGAEYLRLEGEVFVPPRADGKALNLARFKPSDLGGRFRATFIKPALWGSRNDLVSSLLVERDRTGGSGLSGYTSNKVEAAVGVRHRFSDKFYIQGGVAFEHGRTSDALGDLAYTIAGLPMSAVYDSTDNPLDPTKGIKAQLSVTPYFALSGAKNFVEGRGQISAYHAFDEDGRYILAGRLGFGTIVGADLAHLPASHRMYAGGGASVRGYANRSLAPTLYSAVVGGRSLIEGSLEARIKVTDTIGVVPFFDAGGAFRGSVPDFSTDTVRYAAGLGLRYYTGIGPIRLDVAFPLNKRSGDRPVAVYIGIGQAF